MVLRNYSHVLSYCIRLGDQFATKLNALGQTVLSIQPQKYKKMALLEGIMHIVANSHFK